MNIERSLYSKQFVLSQTQWSDLKLLQSIFQDFLKNTWNSQRLLKIFSKHVKQLLVCKYFQRVNELRLEFQDNRITFCFKTLMIKVGQFCNKPASRRTERTLNWWGKNGKDCAAELRTN